MPKGGARTRSGPAPDPQALRRERGSDGEWLQLPAEGRKGRAPAWPLRPMPSNREKGLWSSLWRKPQAVAWQRQGSEMLVGLYVRRFAEAERRHSAVNLSTLVRQLADELGLTEAGMARNRWRIAADEVKEKREAKPAATSARDRFTVVAGEGGS